MCRQAWFPPKAGRDLEQLEKFLRHHEIVGGSAGCGYGIGPAGRTGEWTVQKSLELKIADVAQAIYSRPSSYWAAFHCRRRDPGISGGLVNSLMCHPHVAGGDGDPRVVLTHNGTWREWERVRRERALGDDLPSDSAVLATLISKIGLRQALAEVSETILVAMQDPNAKWQVYANVGSHWGAPLVRLANGTIATGGCTGLPEYEVVTNLDSGLYRLNATRPVRVKLTPDSTNDDADCGVEV